VSNFNSGKEGKQNKKIIKQKKSEQTKPHGSVWGETEVLFC
jgi:hypothetical protein